MVEKSSEYIENKCCHWALQLILIGKDAHRKGNIKHVRTWFQAISSNFSRLFRSKIAKIAKDKCSHCVIVLDYCFRWLSTAPSHRIIALWVHPLKVWLNLHSITKTTQNGHQSTAQFKPFTMASNECLIKYNTILLRSHQH